MFIYWDGFEIDGSDTAFDIVLPERVQVWEFVECFLSLPIFDHTIKPRILCRHGNHAQKLSPAAFKEKVLSGDFPAITISMNCLHIEKMSEDLRKALYKLSETRVPPEKAYGITENPCMPPVIPATYDRGNMTVDLTINKAGIKNGYANTEELEGCVHNPALIYSSQHLDFEIALGPSFYYEYAMHIIETLRDAFPDLGTCGGLDCGGGWTGGGTYAASLYHYEKIQLPIPYSLRNTLKRLTEYGIIRSYERYYWSKKGWKFKYGEDFFLANTEPVVYGTAARGLPFEDYLAFAEEALAMDGDSFSVICKTAVQIKLPSPTQYEKNQKAMNDLTAALPEEGLRNDWYFRGHLAFAKIGDNAYAEFRVYYTMKKYLLLLLDLASSGEIDFIKAVTYERRHKK